MLVLPASDNTTENRRCTENTVAIEVGHFALLTSSMCHAPQSAVPQYCHSQSVVWCGFNDIHIVYSLE